MGRLFNATGMGRYVGVTSTNLLLQYTVSGREIMKPDKARRNGYWFLNTRNVVFVLNILIRLG